MVDIRYLAQRIEISFWSVAILLMSESPLVGRLLRLAFAWQQRLQDSPRLKTLAWGAVAGLASGLFLGIVL